MKDLLGTNRCSELGKAFLNLFSLLAPAAISTDFFVKEASLGMKLALAGVSLFVLILGGWLVPPKGEEDDRNS